MAKTMKTVWQGGMKFEHTAATGHTVTTDAPAEVGGTDKAATPMELILLGLIGCTGVDVASILTRMKQPLEGLEVEAEYERAEEHPKVYTRIHLIYRLRGDLDEKKVKRAIELSETKYCSASAMLGRTATITHEYAIAP